MTLKGDLNQLSLLNVIEAISGPLILDTCQVQSRCATQRRKDHCNLKAIWLTTTIDMHEILDQVKLIKLLDN